VTPTSDDERPLLRVVGGGQPSGAELAALVAAVASQVAADGAATAGRKPSRWTDRAAQQRHELRHGPGAWLASTRPRSH
jgi:hypothetical protein